MATSISTLQTMFTRHKKDISDITDALFIDWVDELNRWYHNFISGTAPEQLISVQNYTISNDSQTNSLPTDFQNLQAFGCGLFEHVDNKLGYDAQTGNFTENLTLTGGTSGATATIEGDTDNGTTGILSLSSVSGTFQDGETITDTSTGSATVDIYQTIKTDKLKITEPGSSNKGYFITGSNIIFTSYTDDTVVTMRYIPVATQLTATTDNIIIPDRFVYYVLRALDVRYSIWDEDAGSESLADFRYVRALDELAQNIKQDTPVYGINDFSNIY